MNTKIDKKPASAQSDLHEALGAKYIAAYSDKYAGWCVFKSTSTLMMEYHAGGFSERDVAVSEAKRLNDLEAP